MSERSSRNFQGPRPESGTQYGGAEHAGRAEPSGRADVAAGWHGDHWRAPRDYAEQASAAGQTGARDSRGGASMSGPAGAPEPRPYRYDLEALPRELRDREQLVGGRGYTGIARDLEPRRQGPRGYRRSDDRIREDICEALMALTHLDASEVSVDVTEGIVMLTGIVPERRMKHAIEDATADVRGVLDVENRIRVVRGPGF